MPAVSNPHERRSRAGVTAALTALLAASTLCACEPLRYSALSSDLALRMYLDQDSPLAAKARDARQRLAVGMTSREAQAAMIDLGLSASRVAAADVEAAQPRKDAPAGTREFLYGGVRLPSNDREWMGVMLALVGIDDRDRVNYVDVRTLIDAP